MAIEIFLIVLAVVLFGGMFFGLFLSYREVEAERNKPAPPKVLQVPKFYAWRERDVALAEELMLRQIEHHLRHESLVAERFIRNPSSETLRADEHSRLGFH
jgi:hypothetical protein